ncbi:Serine/Threonine kinase family protein [Medicago truncatula]|nr:Serine/Threonine kinase family protein [Medicago truncatula]
MKPGDILNASATSTLCSKQGRYCMNFNQNTDFDNLTYLSIFAKGKDNWLVWIANRDQPVDMDSAVLSLNQSGALKIESKIGEPIILYASRQHSNNSSNIVATLLDTGNFVLKDIQKNIVLWQSFDHPTDSLLPGMKLGVNRKTGEKWSLVSSISDSSPASGTFRLEWEPTRKELVIKHREKVYWTSGKLLINNTFEYISGEDFEVNVVSNKEEEYFTYWPNEDGFTKWTLLQTGLLINSEGRDIARADLCNGFNTNGGCQKWNELCRNPGDMFDSKLVYVNENMVYDIANTNYGINDCEEICWSNCSCFGFRNFYGNGTGCLFLVSTEGLNIASSGYELFNILVKNTDPKVSNKRIWIYIGIGTLTPFVGLFIVLLAVRKRRHVLRERERMRMQIEDLEGSRQYSDGDDLEGDLSNGDDLKVFTYSSIIVATNGFSSENKLGQGGFGPVFKGILPSEQEVAVKKLSKTSGQGMTEFRNELTLICKLQHTNLVRLIGHCIHERERMLIYEYMPNKSLDFFLFDSNRRKMLDWNKRFSIIEGIAQGLLYLHKYSRLRIIHRDLKASNILLDENMNPKISDFGVARMFTKQETEANTNRIVGTYGYMSPEYAMEGVFSTKSDVYSFGVLLLEIISGKKNNSFYSEDRPINLVGHVWELWKEGAVLQLVDPLLNESFSEDEVLRSVHAGLLCVEENADDRPTMSNVIAMLTNKIKVDILPKKPAYYGGTRVFEEETYGEDVDVDSTYENSYSHVQNIDSSSEEITKLI